MKNIVISYVATGIVFLAIDAVWLTFMAEQLYRPLLGDKLAPQFHLAPAILFYLIFIAGLVLLAVIPALAAGDWRKAAVNGAIMGFVAYATYDLTNQATLRDWPIAITVADMIWGTLLSAVAATAGYVAASRLGD